MLLWSSWRLAALWENQQGGGRRGQSLGGPGRRQLCDIVVCRTGSSREWDTVSFCLVSWHLAPGKHASLALRNTAGGKNLHAGHGFLAPSSLHTSLSFGTQDRGPGHLSLDCEETTLEAKK